jgi:hypothetical protein
MNINPAPCEHPVPDAACATDPRIARAEAWLCMLSHLIGLGAWLVRALIRQAAPGAHDPDWAGPRVAFPNRCNPITLFVRIARAVRLAVALRLKIERRIADLVAGKSPSPIMPAPQAMSRKAARAELPEDGGEATDPRDRDGETAAMARDGDIEGVEEVEDPGDSARPMVLPRDIKEPFGESERFQRLLNGPLKDAVAAICADLGLRPDWSQWTEDGFPPPPGGDVRVWEIFRSSEIDTPPPHEVDGAAHIVWRPRWRRPRRSRAKPPLDPRYDRGPATWPDANDFYFNDILKKGESHEL